MTGSSVQASSFPDLQNKPFSGRETGGQGCSVTASGRNGGQRQLQTNAQAVTRGAPQMVSFHGFPLGTVHALQARPHGRLNMLGLLLTQ